MKARAPRILMLGTALEGRGGVAALVSVLREGGLFEREAVDYVSTHREGGFPARLGSAAGGFWRTARACLWRRPRIMHAHAASGESFVRKSILLWLARAAGCRTIFHLHGGGFRQFATCPCSKQWPAARRPWPAPSAPRRKRCATARTASWYRHAAALRWPRRRHGCWAMAGSAGALARGRA